MGKIYVAEIDRYTADDIPDEEYCVICGKSKSEWDAVKHEDYCPDCYDAVVDGLWDIKKNINHGVCEISELWDAIYDLWDSAFPRGGKDD